VCWAIAASELLELWGTVDILAPGEAERLVAEMQKLCRVDRPQRILRVPASWLLTWSACACCLPAWCPASTPRCAAEDGVQIPVTLHISALRDALGELTGMVAVAVDQSESLHREQAQRESQERYRDLFEHSTEMIATLSPAGQFLYANPAWKRCFGVEQTALLDLVPSRSCFQKASAARWPRFSAAPSTASWWTAYSLRHHTPTAACWNWN
jgi:PAS domain-containing protein